MPLVDLLSISDVRVFFFIFTPKRSVGIDAHKKAIAFRFSTVALLTYLILLYCIVNGSKTVVEYIDEHILYFNVYTAVLQSEKV